MAKNPRVSIRENYKPHLSLAGRVRKFEKLFINGFPLVISFCVSPCLSPFLVLATSPHSWQTKVGRWPDRCCASICRNMSVFILKGETEENKTNPKAFVAELSTHFVYKLHIMYRYDTHPLENLGCFDYSFHSIGTKEILIYPGFKSALFHWRFSFGSDLNYRKRYIINCKMWKKNF